MADIKTPFEEARGNAIRAVAVAASEAKHAIDCATAAAIRELELHEASVATLSGLVERCKHVLVKDVGLDRESVALSEIYVNVGRYHQLRLVEYQGDQAKAPHLHTFDQPAKNYRLWLCIEELP